MPPTPFQATICDKAHNEVSEYSCKMRQRRSVTLYWIPRLGMWGSASKYVSALQVSVCWRTSALQWSALLIVRQHTISME